MDLTSIRQAERELMQKRLTAQKKQIFAYSSSMKKIPN